MLRLFRAGLILAGLMLLAGLAAWLADQPGRIRVTWFGYLIEAPAPLLALGFVLLALGIFALAWMVAWAAALPQRRRLKRQAKGYANFTAGMVAVSAGEPQRAAKLAARAQAQLDDPALARLLTAHAAQLDGNREGARAAFTALAEDPGTAFLGYRGLLSDARQRGDGDAALVYAQRASALRPGSPFAAEAELQLLVERGDWAGAQARLDLARRKKAVPKEAAAQLAARLDLAAAHAALARSEPRPAQKLAEQAAKILPGHPVPPVLLAASAKQGTAGMHALREQASQSLRRAWTRQPCEAYAEAWLELQRDTAMDTLVQRARDFTADRADAPESRLLAAAAALAAHDFVAARALLTDSNAANPGAANLGAWGARLLARLAELSDGDAAEADRWRSRAAAHRGLWQCGSCGSGHPAWMPLCAHCGAFDALDPTRLGETAPLALPPRPLLESADSRRS